MFEMIWKFGRSLARRKILDLEKEDILGTELRRCLTTEDMTLIGISSTLGSGVYILTGDVSGKTGGSIVISITLAAIASILCGLCYTEFAARVPKAGSAYVYSYVVIGEFFAFVVGWNLILEYGIGAASVIKGFTAYVDAVADHRIQNYTISVIGKLKVFGKDLYLDFFSCIVSILTMASVALSVKISSMLNSFCTVVNMIVIVMIVAMGSFYAKSENISNFMPNGMSSVINGASSCYFAFIGFDAVCMVAEEAKKPNKSVPISVITAILTCYVGFIAAAVVLNMMIPYTEMHGSASLATAFSDVGLHSAKFIISIGAIFGLLGNGIASMMMMPRFLYSMAQDGLIFRIFASVHSRTNIPLFSTIFGGFLTALMTLFFELHDLVQMVSVGTILAYTLVTLSILILRYKTEKLGMVRKSSSRLSRSRSRYSSRSSSRHPSRPHSRNNQLRTHSRQSNVSFAYGVAVVNQNNVHENEPDETQLQSQHIEGDQSLQREPVDTSLEDEKMEVQPSESQRSQEPAEDSRVDSDSGRLLSGSVEDELFYEDEDGTMSILFFSLRQRTAMMSSVPTETTQFIATVCAVVVMLEIIALSAILHFLMHRLFKGHVEVIVLLILVCLLLIITSYVISCMPQNNQRLFFKVPFLPWLPIFALFLNIYIMFGLNHLTWIRFGVWMVVGLLIYFGYGYRKSAQISEDLDSLDGSYDNDDEVIVNGNTVVT